MNRSPEVHWHTQTWRAGGKTTEELLSQARELESFHLTILARDVLLMNRSSRPDYISTVSASLEKVFADNQPSDYNAVRRWAYNYGLQECTAPRHVALLKAIRDAEKNPNGRPYTVSLVMTPCLELSGYPVFLEVSRYDGQVNITVDWALPDRKFDPGRRFIFSPRK